MSFAESDAFADTRITLYLARLLNRLEQERRTSPELASLIESEERRNGFMISVPLINQATFLQVAYMTLVRTREEYFPTPELAAGKILEEAVRNLMDEIQFAGDRPAGTGAEVVRWLRNALAHSRVEVTDTSFVFTDKGSGKGATTVVMTMAWPVLGQICEAVILAGNELLYPPGARSHDTQEP